MQEQMKLRSSIKPALMRRALLRGFAWAFAGAVILIFAGAKLSLEALNSWGLPLFATGIACITFGLLPFRRLSRLELKPSELIVAADQLEWWENGRRLMTIPLEAIAGVVHIDEVAKYGISLTIRQDLTRKLIIYDPKLQRPPLPLFLPYFSKRACEELKNEVYRSTSVHTVLEDLH